MQRATVKVAYTPQYDDSDELTLSVGDIIVITDRSDEANGWLIGECNGKEGVFPANIIELIRDAPPPPTQPKPNTFVPPPTPTSVMMTDMGTSPAPAPVPAPVPTPVPEKPVHVNPTPVVSSQTSGPVAKTVNVAASEHNRRKRQTLFGLYGHYGALMSGTFWCVTGFVMLAWGTYGNAPSPIYDNPRYFRGLDAFWGAWSAVMGLLVVLYEVRYGKVRQASHRFPSRGLIYLLITIPSYFALPTAIGAGTMVMPALMHIYSSLIGEYYMPPPLPKKPAKDSDDDDLANFNCCQKFCVMFGGRNPDKQIGRIFFLVLYIAGCLAAGITHAIHAYNLIQDVKDWNDENHRNPTAPPTPDREYHTYWLLPAKFFGNIMNFNFTFILLPVSHSLMRWIVNNSRHRAWYAYILRVFLFIIPVDDAIKIHKLCAYVGFVSAIGHTVSHLFNYVQKAALVWDTYGAGIWVTGIILIMSLFIIYPATQMTVKRGHFEIFWVTHMLYVVVIVMSFIHGKGMIGPNYWKWLCAPGSIYVLERIYREYTTRQPVNVISVTFMSNQVISILVEKSGALAEYNEGQYAYISCPSISALEFHPFTISSAPQEKYVSFHIRVQGKGSWTHSLRELFRVLGSGTNKACLKLARMEDGQLVPGLIDGPNGIPLLRIHGPYSAPTQNFSLYNEVLICASGIGVTPLASALKSIVHFRWQYSVDRAFPDRARFVWVVAHKEISAFRWLVRTIREAEEALNNQKGKSQSTRQLGIDIFITSFSQAESEKFLRTCSEEQGAEDAGLWGLPYDSDTTVSKSQLSWTEMDLYTAMMNPQKGTVTIGNVRITLGRPDWNKVFDEIHQVTPEKDVGVTFCGNPRIGKDLKSACLKNSLRTDKKVTWHLHKEVF